MPTIDSAIQKIASQSTKSGRNRNSGYIGKRDDCGISGGQKLVIFSTPKFVNHDKTDFATKQRKSHKRKILQQNSIKCDKTSKIVHIIYFTMLKEMTNQGEESGEERKAGLFLPELLYY